MAQEEYFSQPIESDGAPIQPPPFLPNDRSGQPAMASKTPSRWPRRLWFFAALLAAAGCIAATVFLWSRDGSDKGPHPPHAGPTTGTEAPIFEVTSNFADALDEQDIGKLSMYMCEVDRAAYLDYYPQADVDAGGVDKPEYRDLTVSGVEIRGTVARASVSRTGNANDATFYYRKEGGTWLVCTDAETEFEAAPPSSTSASQPTSSD